MHSPYGRRVAVTTATGANVSIATFANSALESARSTSTLKNLIIRCRARYPADSPSLREVLHTCERWALHATEADFRILPPSLWVDETDQAIEGVIQELVLNADVNEQFQRLAFGQRVSSPAGGGSGGGGARRGGPTGRGGLRGLRRMPSARI